MDISPGKLPAWHAKNAMEKLQTANCDLLQGYLVRKPKRALDRLKARLLAQGIEETISFHVLQIRMPLADYSVEPIERISRLLALRPHWACSLIQSVPRLEASQLPARGNQVPGAEPGTRADRIYDLRPKFPLWSHPNSILDLGNAPGMYWTRSSAFRL